MDINHTATDTFSLEIPKADSSLLKSLVKRMGWTVHKTTVKRTAYEQQGGVCACCGKKFDYKEMEGDHITPWREGGKTEPQNLQMLCRDCNRRKGKK